MVILYQLVLAVWFLEYSSAITETEILDLDYYEYVLQYFYDMKNHEMFRVIPFSTDALMEFSGGVLDGDDAEYPTIIFYLQQDMPDLDDCGGLPGLRFEDRPYCLTEYVLTSEKTVPKYWDQKPLPNMVAFEAHFINKSYKQSVSVQVPILKKERWPYIKPSLDLPEVDVQLISDEQINTILESYAFQGDSAWMNELFQYEIFFVLTTRNERTGHSTHLFKTVPVVLPGQYVHKLATLLRPYE